ncbi:hypothetical protein [Fretibacter rubidus]|uniref:hypothetical protein n=1 Tax=Fretibacter rubidus TaxID=570162 RepID=UPI00352B2737
MNRFQTTKFGRAVLALSFLAFAVSAPATAAENTFEEPPQRVYDNIPANWDDYMLEPGLLKKYKGEDLKQIVFYDDLIKPPLQYQTVRVTRDQEFAVLQGGKSFIVVDPKNIIIGTANTGVNIIKTRGCRENLRRAKYVLLNMEKPNRRYRRGQYINIMTRTNSGLKSCRIDSINEWTGPVNLVQLRAENEAIIKKSGNLIQPVTDHFRTYDGRPV